MGFNSGFKGLISVGSVLHNNSLSEDPVHSILFLGGLHPFFPVTDTALQCYFCQVFVFHSVDVSRPILLVVSNLIYYIVLI
jgi:hypothetical protein